MRHMRQRMRDKYPRTHKIIKYTYNKTADTAFSLGYWGMTTAALYVYILQYNRKGCKDNVHND